MMKVSQSVEDQIKLLELKIKRRTTPPYWWPDANIGLQYFLSWSIVAIVGFVIYQLMGNVIKLAPEQRDLLMILFGVVLACFKDVYGFTFGSSAGQKKQGEAITKSLEDKDKIIATNASATADVTTAALAAATAVAPLAARVEAPPAAEAAAPAAAAAAAVAEAMRVPPSPDVADPKFGGKP